MKNHQYAPVVSKQDRSALEIASIYLLIGILWILFSDKLAVKIAPNQTALTAISIYKGWGYVLVTALLLYWLIRRHTHRITRMELTLTEGEQNYQELLQQASNGILIADPTGQYTFVNEEACRLLGYTNTELLSMNLRELIAPEDLQKTPPRLDELRNGKTLITERKLLRKDGSRILCEISAKQLRDGRYQSIIRDITERKVIDEALTRSERRYRSLFENMASGFARCQMLYDERDAPKDFIFLDVNQTFEKLTGLKNVLGKQVSGVIPGIHESNPELLEICSRVALTGTPEKFETYMPGLGSGIWFSVSVYSTEKNFFVTIFDAITERKQAETALRENEERLRLSLHAANQGLYDLNVQTGAAIVNREYAEMLGYDPDSFNETNAAWIERLHPDDREITTNAYSDYIKGLTPEYRVEFRQKTNGGDWKWILSLGKLIEYDHAGKPLRMVGTHTDITERKEAETKLRHSEEQYRHMFTNNPQPMWVFDRETFAFLAVNDATVAHYGYSREEFLQMTIKDIRPSEDIPALANIVAAKSEPYLNAGIWKHRKKDGTLIDVEITRHEILFDGHDALIVLVNDVTERKQAEIAQRQSEQKFSTLFNKAPFAATLSTFPEGIILEANEEFEKLIGYPREAVIGKTSLELHMYPEPDTRARMAAEFQSQGYSHNVEMTLQTKSGDLRNLLVNTDFVELAGKKHLLTTAQDITEREQAEAALRERERKLSTLFEILPVGISILDAERKVTLANRTLANILGLSQDDLLNGLASNRRYINETGAPMAIHEFASVRALQEKRPIQNVVTGIVKEDNSLIWTNVSAVPVNFSDWKVVIVTTDITERKQVDKIRAQLAAIVDSSEDAIIGKTLEGVITSWNIGAERLYNYSAAEIVGQPISILIPSDRQDELPEILNKLKNGESIKHFETQRQRKDGTRLFVSLTISPIKDAVGQITGASTIARDITERKQAEDALRASEEKFSILFEKSAFAIVLSILPDGTIMNVNEAFERIFGYTRLEAAGKTTLELGINPDAEGRARSLAALKEYGFVRDLEIMLRVKSGERRLMSVNIDFIDIGGQKYILNMMQDITERKQAQAQIEYQAKLLENVSEAIIATDEKQMITSWNHGAENLYGWDAAETIGRSAQQIIRSEFSESQRAEAVKALTETGDFRTEVIQYHRNGQMFWTEGHTISVRDETGKVTGFVAINRDITDRKQAEDELRQSQENFAKAFVSNPAAIAITRLADGKFININPAYTRIMEYEPHEILDHTAAEMNIYVYPEERDQIIRQLREQGNIQNYELRVRTKTGDMRSIVISMEPLVFNKEECILTVFIDISERQKMEAELLRSNADLEQFAYVASHDLQEPLRAVAGMVQLLQQRYQGKLDERADEYIGHAVDASTRMQKLINDLLDYSRVNRLGRSFENTAVERSLNTALANLQVVIQESQAQITHDPLPTLMADAGQLTQVLQNLIGNAIKFRGARPLHIHIGAKKIEQDWQFEVSDNGIGIEPKYYERIFLVFQRLHTRREYPGTGIGLALCKKIIERHNGRIWVESQPGAGSTFYFTIPER